MLCCACDRTQTRARPTHGTTFVVGTCQSHLRGFLLAVHHHCLFLFSGEKVSSLRSEFTEAARVRHGADVQL